MRWQQKLKNAKWNLIKGATYKFSGNFQDVSCCNHYRQVRTFDLCQAKKKNGELSISATRPQSRSCSSIGFLINYEIFLFGFGRLGGGQARWGRHNFWCTWKTPSKKGTLFAFPLTIQFLVFLSFRWVSVWLLRKCRIKRELNRNF